VATFILTVVGDDRPGLVAEVSAPITAHGASWERSQMSRLAGKFAGIVLVKVTDKRLDALVADLALLEAEGLQVVIERTQQPWKSESQRLRLELLGHDHPGIVAEISAALAKRQVSIEELSTDVREVPMAGGMLFEAQAALDAPLAASIDDLRSTLEGLAHELMVEIRLSETESGHTG
jgi:glycine cleavage system regulatory protein